jgi:hypothetical protein
MSATVPSGSWCGDSAMSATVAKGEGERDGLSCVFLSRATAASPQESRLGD